MPRGSISTRASTLYSSGGPAHPLKAGYGLASAVHRRKTTLKSTRLDTDVSMVISMEKPEQELQAIKKQ